VAVLKVQAVPPILVVIVFVIAVPLIVINGVVAVRRGYPGRWPFLFSAVVLSASFLIKVLSYELSSLISSREASMTLLYAIALEAMLLSLTLFLQVRHLRQQKEQALIEQVETANANLRLAQSMSHAAHDIQQPLSSLRLALSSDAARENREGEFHKAIDYLESIVSRQLTEFGNAPQADQGHEDGPAIDMIEPFEMDVVLKNVAVMFADEAAAKGLDFRVVASTAITETNVFAVTRILANLAANAIRNTENGKVLIGCRRQKAAVCLDIYDTGNGFSDGEIEALMLPHARNGNYTGNGLGLSIVQTLCREHGYGFDIKNNPGAGAHFRIRLPKPTD
jgi:signal transduction histidine kinase